MKMMIINGIQYAVKVHQENASVPFLFMLHGFMGDGRVFHHIIEDLLEVCNPVTVDLLGHGKSEKVYAPDRYREERQIDDIVEIVKQTIAIDSDRSIENSASHTGNKNTTGIENAASDENTAAAKTVTGTDTDTHAGITPARPLLYGYSMGGRLALKTALKFPELFGGLILESTNYGISDDAERAERRQVDARRTRQITKDYPAFLAEWDKLPLFETPHEPDKKLENRYKEIHLAQEPEAMAASLEGFSTGAMKLVRKAITNYKMTAMIVAGTGDQKYMKIGQSLASYFSEGSFCPIPAGHRVHLDNPDALTAKISHFIGKSSIS